MSTTLERDRRGAVIAILDGEHRRRVVRDKAGRIASVDGDSRLNDLAEILTRLVRAETSDAADAADDLSAIATEHVTELEAVAARCEQVATERMTELEAVAVQCEQGQRDAATELEAVAARHAQALADAAQRLEGWVRVDGGLLVSKPNLADAVQRLAITWPITIDWMTADDAADSDEAVRDEYGSSARVHGYRAPSHSAAHTIVLRPGRAEETGRTFVHELVHCRQVEWWRGLFDLLYRTADGRDALERQADSIAVSVTAELELFRASPQHEPDTF